MQTYYNVFHRFKLRQWWFNIKLKPILSTASAVSKIEALFKEKVRIDSKNRLANNDHSR